MRAVVVTGREGLYCQGKREIIINEVRHLRVLAVVYLQWRLICRVETELDQREWVR